MQLFLMVAWAFIVPIVCDYLTDTWKLDVADDTRSKNLRGQFVEVAVDGGSMATYVSKPTGGGRSPAVIVAHHAVGIYHHSFLRKFADDLAHLGYVAVLPDFFHRTWSDSVPNGLGMPFDKMNIGAMLGGLRDHQILADVTSVLSYLERDHEVDEGKVGILGFCMGGRIAWLAAVEASLKGKIHAAVPYHGGNVFKGLGDGAEAPADRIKDNLSCPVLGHFGALDKNPSPQDMSKLQELAGPKLKAKVYADSDHGFSCQDSAKYVEAAAKESWAETVQFFKSVFGTSTKEEL